MAKQLLWGKAFLSLSACGKERLPREMLRQKGRQIVFSLLSVLRVYNSFRTTFSFYALQPQISKFQAVLWISELFLWTKHLSANATFIWCSGLFLPSLFTALNGFFPIKKKKNGNCSGQISGFVFICSSHILTMHKFGNLLNWEWSSLERTMFVSE